MKFRTLFIGLICAFAVLPLGATTLQVFSIWNAVTLYGTDSDYQPQGFEEAVQARVMSRPMVLQGAFPEVLIDGISAPVKLPVLPSGASFGMKESNLVILCKVALSAEYKNESLRVTINIEKMEIPQKLQLSEKQLVMLVMESVEKTLRENIVDQPVPMKVAVRVIGTDEENVVLGRLEKNFAIGS